MLLHSLNLNEARLFTEDIDKLEEDIGALINTSKYDLTPTWPLGEV